MTRYDCFGKEIPEEAKPKQNRGGPGKKNPEKPQEVQRLSWG